MISSHSKDQIKAILDKMGYHSTSIGLGEVEIEENLSSKKLQTLRKELIAKEFDIILDKEIILIEKVKNIVIDMIHYSKQLPMIKYSEFISREIDANYSYLSKLFSKINGITIEHFIIAQKIERAKQLLAFKEFTLEEIAWMLQYSSAAHLSAQFKKVTGLTPSFFKKMEPKHFVSPEEI